VAARQHRGCGAGVKGECWAGVKGVAAAGMHAREAAARLGSRASLACMDGGLAASTAGGGARPGRQARTKSANPAKPVAFERHATLRVMPNRASICAFVKRVATLTSRTRLGASGGRLVGV
jgi:hypothetical protein